MHQKLTFLTRAFTKMAHIALVVLSVHTAVSHSWYSLIQHVSGHCGQNFGADRGNEATTQNTYSEPYAGRQRSTA
ncbi:hypothetical protein EDB81DRAFT_471745 [Dactylonectria macrodidyma]|uniref:Uncharacterized protein n=1 Tax=Dactylonectria macrodidyma TaxID=307937 RepID=A0A9P9J3N8_9HYPO|nr:hypothetical protein EDB81DRAFT_471745 [Dactylonectria macrodidyma]